MPERTTVPLVDEVSRLMSAYRRAIKASHDALRCAQVRMMGIDTRGYAEEMKPVLAAEVVEGHARVALGAAIDRRVKEHGEFMEALGRSIGQPGSHLMSLSHAVGMDVQHDAGGES